MSTKIQDGYRLAPGTDLFDFCDRVRAVMNPIRDRLDAEMLVVDAVHQYDQYVYRDARQPANPWSVAHTEHLTRTRSASKDSYDSDPNRFEFSVGRLNRSGGSGDWLMVRLFCDHDEFRDAWNALPEVQDYSYWDNADRPEDLTEKQWEARREAWAEMMPDFKPPVNTMLTFALRATDDINIGLFDREEYKDREAIVHSLVDAALIAEHSPTVRATRLLSNAVVAKSNPGEAVTRLLGKYRTVLSMDSFLRARDELADHIPPLQVSDLMEVTPALTDKQRLAVRGLFECVETLAADLETEMVKPQH